jgi:hypothetical protein
VSTALVTIQPVFTESERLALAGFLAGYRSLAREAYTLDLRQFTAWCRIAAPWPGTSTFCAVGKLAMPLTCSNSARTRPAQNQVIWSSAIRARGGSQRAPIRRATTDRDIRGAVT